jgi:hypothetical protein
MASQKDGISFIPGKENEFHFVRAGKLHFFCPLCQYHQSTSTIERMGLKHHAQIALVTIALAVLAYPLCGFDGALFYLPLWAGFEFFYRLRKRQALVCRSCGFDPFLYKQDVARARAALKAHWETRIANENLFSNLKLKNYQTAARVNVNAEAKSAEALKNPEAPAAKSP